MQSIFVVKRHLLRGTQKANCVDMVTASDLRPNSIRVTDRLSHGPVFLLSCGHMCDSVRLSRRLRPTMEEMESGVGRANRPGEPVL